jgi:tetratricopeptide (TPR) repeat protein
MNRWRPFQVLCVLSFYALPATAAQAPAADPGHGMPGHRHEAGPAPKEETTVDYLWRKSDEAFHEGDYERAIGCHKAIVVLAPDDVESYGVAAWLMWSLGKSEDSLQHLLRGLKANPENWEMWHTAGQQYDLQKKVAEAKAAYQRAVTLIPATEDSQMLRRRLAHAAERAADLKLSVETWQGLVRDFPNEAVNKNNLARVERLAAAPAT